MIIRRTEILQLSPPILIFIDDAVIEAGPAVAVPVDIAVDIVDRMLAIEDMSILTIVKLTSWCCNCCIDIEMKCSTA